jgi:hypothetical protein
MFSIVTSDELHEEELKGVLLCCAIELYQSPKEIHAIVMETTDSLKTIHAYM